jgi:hypothetical protein
MNAATGLAAPVPHVEALFPVPDMHAATGLAAQVAHVGTLFPVPDMHATTGLAAQVAHLGPAPLVLFRSTAHSAALLPRISQ